MPESPRRPFTFRKSLSSKYRQSLSVLATTCFASLSEGALCPHADRTAAVAEHNTRRVIPILRLFFMIPCPVVVVTWWWMFCGVRHLSGALE
ncbi:hypothetical protein BDI4_570049 [Burkholderia diffusa]|nr:hypothetical protein BDI4_570049 [Burkholderia diffusa]